MNNDSKTNKEFSAIYAKNYPTIVNHINFNYPTLGIETAQDIAQEVFIKAYRFLHTFDSEKSVIETWLITIANTVVIDYWRTNKYGRNTVKITDDNKEKTTAIYYQFKDNSTRADSKIMNVELRERINKAFAVLNKREQEIAKLYFVMEMEYKEIVAELNIPMGSVKGTINRIREKLQAQLKSVRFA